LLFFSSSKFFRGYLFYLQGKANNNQQVFEPISNFKGIC